MSDTFSTYKHGIQTLNGAGTVPAGDTGAAGQAIDANFIAIANNFDSVVNQRGAWSNATTYAVNDLVTYSGVAYIAIVTNTNSQPDTHPSNWTPYVAPATDSTPGTLSAADKTKLDNATAVNNDSTIVMRDVNGSFAANIITAQLQGNATSINGSINENQVNNLPTDLSNLSTGLTTAQTFETGVVYDGGGSVISGTGSKVYKQIDTNGTIQAYTVLADQSGSITVTVKKASYANFPTTADITGGHNVVLSSAQKNTDSTLTGWSTSITAGDILEFAISGTPSAVTKVTVILKIKRG